MTQMTGGNDRGYDDGQELQERVVQIRRGETSFCKATRHGQPRRVLDPPQLEAMRQAECYVRTVPSVMDASP